MGWWSSSTSAPLPPPLLLPSFFLVLLFLQGHGTVTAQKKDKILMIGGNGFIGSHSVEAFVAEGYDVTVMHRGRTHFSPPPAATNVSTIIWDRNQPFEDCQALQDYMQSGPPLAVLDFSCYDAKAATALGRYLLRWPVRWYIYLSSDSVYEVSVKQHPGPSKEDDAIRPTDPQEVERLKDLDPYAHHKLGAEEALMSIWEEAHRHPPQPPPPHKPWDFVFVRVPDVAGPRDTSRYKWWWYQGLIKVQKDVGLPIPIQTADEAGRKLSLVYAKDIARAMLWLVGPDNHKGGGGPAIINQAVNLAGYEQLTFKQVMEDIQRELGVEKEEVLVYSVDDEYRELPSVQRGPIDLSLAREAMGWQSTPWGQVVKEAVAFYESAMTSAKEAGPRKQVLDQLFTYARRFNKANPLADAFIDVYGLPPQLLEEYRDQEPQATFRSGAGEL